MLLKDSLYDDAKALFETISDYRDASEKMKECDYRKADMMFLKGEHNEARDLFASLGNYSDSEDRVKRATLVIGEQFYIEGSFQKAQEEFLKFPDDPELSYWSKCCDMETIRDLTLAKKYSKAGMLLAEFIKDEEFLSRYYGGYYDVSDYTSWVDGKTIQIANCRQYYAHGGVEIGMQYYYDKDVMNMFFYRVTDRKEKWCGFVEYYPDGRLISHP